MIHIARRFEKLFLAHEADLRAFIASVVRLPAAREDVMQEVALTLWRNFHRYDPARSFGAWARGIARHKVFDQLRRDSRCLLTMGPEAVQALDRAFGEEMTVSSGGSTAQGTETALAECLEQLPARSTDLLTRRYTGGEEISQLAARFDTSATAIYQQLSRLRAALGDCIRRRLARRDEEDDRPAPRPFSNAQPL
ncbi:MAG: sigma-70 family RNA polymerase sigma factor [Verrucomicrobiaceae bacterium]|nr:MAG: sigma-70 family RNA polymerase sigma factor [Verrucomicrobiaceae bacterium]